MGDMTSAESVDTGAWETVGKVGIGLVCQQIVGPFSQRVLSAQRDPEFHSGIVQRGRSYVAKDLAGKKFADGLLALMKIAQTGPHRAQSPRAREHGAIQ